jgi:hypothetical protein
VGAFSANWAFLEMEELYYLEVALDRVAGNGGRLDGGGGGDTELWPRKDQKRIEVYQELAKDICF